ncbi:MAG: acyl-CoA dehydrogenase family protein [Candidatus Rokubacteria bacterium]|nr:acyl-CoA dehydrogenase family protein [Candidatus Rokubacteria bacterium]
MPPAGALLSTVPPIVRAVRDFVETEVRPVAGELDHADRYPHALVARMQALGLFGALIPGTYGGLGLSVSTYARVIEELCRGWMSLAGVINSHTMAALIVLGQGTEEQRQRLLPRFARGEARGGLCLTEPHAGSDVQAIRTLARREGDHYLISGSKMFVTNGREGNTFALLARTDPDARPAHRGMSCFIVEKGSPGLEVVKSIAKLGYKGVDTAELLFDGFPCPAANLVGGVEGRGFKHVMSGLETGRINIAARAVGVAQAALEGAAGAVRHGRAVGPTSARLAAVATRVEAARLLTHWASERKDRGERCDLEAGMAKLYASEGAQEVAVETVRLVGPRSQLEALPIERYYRDAPLMIIGEGTNEIQRLLIARQLLERHGERFGSLVSVEGEPEERRQMVLAVRQLVEKELAPIALDLETRGEWPGPALGRLADLGVFGALAPAGDGGLGADLRTLVMLVEEVARGWGLPAALVATQAAAVHALACAWPAGNERWLPRLARAEMWAALALSGRVTASPIEGGFALDGAVPLVENAPRAGLFLVRAALPQGGDGCFALAADAAGLAVGPPQTTVGFRGLARADLTLSRLRLGEAALLGRDPTARAAALDAVEHVRRLTTAALAVGIAQAAFEAALRYAQQRTAFGVPICQHQAIQLKLADMATWLTAARLLAFRAAERLDADPADGAGAAMAELDAPDTAYQVTLEAMRIHGGYGYTREFAVERFYRDAGALLRRDVEDGRLEEAVARRALDEAQ